jgi:hypothetical protein
VEAQFAQILLEVLPALLARIQHGRLAVHHEDNAVHALQHQLPGAVVEDLARHGVELELGLETAHHAYVHGQQIEEQGAVRLGVQAHHFTAGLLAGLGVDGVEVGGLSAQTGPVVDDFRRHLPGGVVEKHHSLTSCGPTKSSPETGSDSMQMQE